MRPATSTFLHKGFMIAQCRMNGSKESDARIKGRRHHRKCPTLAGACHTKCLPVILRQSTDEIYCTQSTDNHPVIIEIPQIIPAESPITIQCTIHQVIIKRLLHSNGNTVDANFQCDCTLFRCINITGIRTNTCTGHTQQSRILTFFFRHTKDTVETGTPTICLKAYMINIDCCSASFGKQSHQGLKRCPAGAFQLFHPKFTKIRGKLRNRLQLFGSISSGRQSFVFTVTYMCRHFATQESGCLHRPLQL